jgi:hypothetical protein
MAMLIQKKKDKKLMNNEGKRKHEAARSYIMWNG